MTDHDSVDGVASAIETGERLGVRVVPGVEINTDYGGGEVHILGYFVDYTDPHLLEILRSQREGRLERNRQIVEKLRALGMDVTLDRVLEIAGGEASPGRPHIAWALMEKGYVGSIQDAFDRFLTRGAPAYVPRHKFLPEQAIRAVLEAGGVPVLAHPGLLGGNGIIGELIPAGLMGLEAYYPEHDEFLTQQLVETARKRGLIVTGGTDWHGPLPERAGIGSVEVPPEVIEGLERARDRVRRGIAHA